MKHLKNFALLFVLGLVLAAVACGTPPSGKGASAPAVTATPTAPAAATAAPAATSAPIVVTATPPAPAGGVTVIPGPVIVTATPGSSVRPVAPTAAPNTSGLTNCADAQKLVSGSGTVADPYIYPKGYAHDLCFPTSNNGTGAKYIKIYGPAALQMGEFTGPARMVLVPDDVLFTGWTQGGWAYVSEAALRAQWKIENQAAGKLGLICGYERNLQMHTPAYRWDGTKEVLAPDLDCAIPLTAAAPAASSLQDWQNYPFLVKFQWNGVYYCGALAKNATFPSGYVHVEKYEKFDYDGNYLHSTTTPAQVIGYCSNTKAPDGTSWTTMLVEAPSVVKPVSFPLP